MAELVKKCPEYNRRAAIVKSLRAGCTVPEMVKFFGYSKSTVYDIAHRYVASEGSEEGLLYAAHGRFNDTPPRTRHPNVASLKAAIEASFASMEKEIVTKICARFRPRIEAVIEVERGYIE
ncbi:hypothetical protein ALC62_14152 [Cyphomyrmex costatus]|uniref:Uncharacterized protein n=1 Tax=Cyphomyrmex costatus TaxID=456900 RepID=A0A195C4Y8_9HYME|nr:hypothetical protein ALC62_14152 [Cyphomyrmex costatus]